MADFEWTAEQAAAITSRDDTLLVANAGTGKTTTVVGKVLWLLGIDVGVDGGTGRPIPRCDEPCELHEIAAITFTEKAAYDLKRKLRQEVLGSERADELRWDVDRATVGTIHSFCAGLLREHALRLGIDPTFRVLDEAEARQEMDEVVRDVVLEALEEDDEGVGELFREKRLRGYRGGGLMDLVEAAVRDLRWRPEAFARWSGDGAPDGGALSVARLREACEEWSDGLDDLAVERCDTLYRLGGRVVRRWERFLRAENARDFDAMILDARRLLTGASGGAAVGELRRRYRIVIVDEFQDTDRAQRDVVHAIGRGVPRPQLFLVGDPKQSIYRFRGADVSVWNEVEREMRQEGRVRPLTRNFRSTPEVVAYANRAGGLALEGTGAALEKESPGGRVAYSDLEVGRADAAGGTGAGGAAASGAAEPAGGSAPAQGAVEWIAATAKLADDRRRAEAAAVVARIEATVDALTIPDPDDGTPRPLRYRDVALLYRTGTGIEHYERMLRDHGIPFHNAQPPNLDERQEVADLLNALRLVENPRDDVRAFGFLRSPFVGLRDEVVARMRLDDRSGSLLGRARRWLEEGEWWEAPEHPRVVEIEREALRRGIGALDEARLLSSRIPLDELGRLLLDRTGYLGHLVVTDRHEEAVAHLHAFLRQLEAHRHLLLGRFLEMWDRREEADQGVPSAPLHSREDDVVTFSTMHRAKGLEWPVVFLIDVCDWKIQHATNDVVADRDLGPVLMPKQKERGARAGRMHDRWQLEEAAEEARVLYVALTRARERLIVVSEADPSGALAEYLARGRGDGVEPMAPSEPPATGDAEAPPSLSWLDRVEGERPDADARDGPSPAARTAPTTAGPGDADLPPLARPLARPRLRATTSATELMMRAEDPDRWEMRYLHGVQPPWEFAPSGGGGDDGAPVPARVRGTLIHGVLERIREASELAEILDETVGELDAPELEAHLSPGSRYRRALEDEIRRVVESHEWAWYVEGEHHRELPFVDLAERPWRLGSFDLYRPREGESWIVDFKTHVIGADEVQGVAEGYDVQVGVYTAAAAVRGPVRMRLHFTSPNEVVDTPLRQPPERR